MIIDFHTHIFPDHVAERAMKSLREGCEDAYIPVHGATVSAINAYMNENGIDKSVTLPVITKQSQFKSANDFAAQTASDTIIPFGGVYPHTDDYKRDIDYVCSLGLKGIKFHAEYQDFVLDDGYMLKIYDYALSKDLIIIHHAGFDPAFKPPFKTSPRQFKKISDILGGGVIIAAHLGGHDQWPDVFEHLAGSRVYLDTSMGFEYYGMPMFIKIVQKHGCDKILFASDGPWSDAGTEIKQIKNALPTEDDINAILGGNALRLLRI